MSVLLVDDNHEVQALVELTLEKSGLQVVSVNDGLSALDAAISNKPDLILADISVKGIDIATFVKKIQRRPALASTPIVLLQGESVPGLVARELGAVHTIIKKPLDPLLLLNEVKRQMGIVEDVTTLAEEEPTYLPIAEDFLLEEPVPLEEKTQTAGLVLPPAEKAEKTDFKVDVDPEKVDAAIRKIVLEVVERVAWEIIPGIVETAMPRGKVKELVEQIVWEVVPPLAEIEIKKEIKRLQPDEGFSG